MDEHHTSDEAHCHSTNPATSVSIYGLQFWSLIFRSLDLCLAFHRRVPSDRLSERVPLPRSCRRLLLRQPSRCKDYGPSLGSVEEEGRRFHRARIPHSSHGSRRSAYPYRPFLVRLVGPGKASLDHAGSWSGHFRLRLHS